VKILMSKYLIYIIGFAAQLLFSARIIIQWIMSEKAKKVVSPTIFWVLSLIAAYLLFIYGWLREDFAIMLGQVISYYIYIWNIKQKDAWKYFPLILKIPLIITPIIGIGYIVHDWQEFVNQCFKNSDIPLALLIYGSIGQVTFTLRFIYQYYYSKKLNESMLPAGFWIISLTGSIIIISYGILRLDPVIILGQSFGFLSYIRNLIIIKKSKKAAQ
jgi:Predicted membrane protein